MDKGRSLIKPAVSCDPLAAAHDLGQAFDVPALAQELNTPVAVLYNKLNPYNESNFLQLREAVRLTELTNDNRILAAWCGARGGMFVPMPEGVQCDEELSDQLLDVTAVLGEAMAEIKASRADGVITPQERQQIGLHLRKSINELLKLDSVVASQVRSLHPRG